MHNTVFKIQVITYNTFFVIDKDMNATLFRIVCNRLLSALDMKVRMRRHDSLVSICSFVTSPTRTDTWRQVKSRMQALMHARATSIDGATRGGLIGTAGVEKGTRSLYYKMGGWAPC